MKDRKAKGRRAKVADDLAEELLLKHPGFRRSIRQARQRFRPAEAFLWPRPGGG